MAGLGAIGIDVGGTGTKGAVVDPDGNIRERAEIATDPHAGTKGILQVAEQLLEWARREGVTVDAIGVGAAGFVDHAKGCVTFSPNVVYDDPDLGNALMSHTGVKAVIENDANAAVWGERTFGTARGFDHVAMLTLGTGVGSGFITAGRLLRGATGAGAEFGHVVIDRDGPPCPCGLRGCLEQFASGGAIGRMGIEAARRDPESTMVAFAGSIEKITARDVARAAREYDQTAMAVLREAGEALAIGMSSIANVFDPDLIVLGGGVISAGEPYLGPARDALVRMTTAQRRRPVRLDVTKLGNEAGILGAAALAAAAE
jgi:glucokinase